MGGKVKVFGLKPLTTDFFSVIFECEKNKNEVRTLTAQHKQQSNLVVKLEEKAKLLEKETCVQSKGIDQLKYLQTFMLNGSSVLNTIIVALIIPNLTGTIHCPLTCSHVPNQSLRRTDFTKKCLLSWIIYSKSTAFPLGQPRT